MKGSPTWFRYLAVFLATAVAVCAEPVANPPTMEELRAVGLPGTAKVDVLAFKSSGAYAFVIFECQSSTRVCYLFRSERIADDVCSGRKGQSGEQQLWTKKEVLEFFILRFKAIANDVANYKWRPDVQLDPPDCDSVKGVLLFAPLYSLYAEAMEQALADQSEKSEQSEKCQAADVDVPGPTPAPPAPEQPK